MAELAGAIGADAARRLAQQFGGTTVYVPRTIGEHHPLRAVLGDAAAAQLSDSFGGVRVAVPKQPERHARVRELRRTGALTISRIALETNYSERHVYRLLSNNGDDRQLDLFGE